MKNQRAAIIWRWRCCPIPEKVGVAMLWRFMGGGPCIAAAEHENDCERDEGSQHDLCPFIARDREVFRE
jgi:hypothetical protein